MKIILDLKHSFNNYHWENEEELREYIKTMRDELWELYNEDLETMSDSQRNRLYDILDMFENFKIEKE